jgi:hypothetical protein
MLQLIVARHPLNEHMAMSSFYFTSWMPKYNKNSYSLTDCGRLTEKNYSCLHATISFSVQHIIPTWKSFDFFTEFGKEEISNMD